MADQAHKIFPHGALQELMPGVWSLSGTMPLPLKRVMTIVRLPDGSLLLHSVIALDDAGMAALDALGKPSIMIVPHTGHRMDPPFYKARYPDLRVVAPAAARAKVEKVIKCDGTCEETLPALGVRAHALNGFKDHELAYELDTPGGKILVMSDAVANDDPQAGLGGWVTSTFTGGLRGRRLGVPRIVRLLLLSDKKAARASLEALAAIPDIKLLTIAHGRALTEGCSDALKEAASML
jgi:hypothetical protein